jgi:hypothetical protein
MAGATVPAGLQTLSLTFTPADWTDYTSVAETTTLQVYPAPATVTPAASGKVFGTLDPVLTGTLTGFLPSDGITATYTRTPGETAGAAYDISATLSPAGMLSNYSITYNTAPFSISPANALVSLGNLSQTYSGSLEAATVSTTPTVAGLSLVYTGTGSTIYGPTATAPTDPGTYSLSAAVVDPNYVGAATGVLTINQADPAVTLGLVAGSPATTPYGTTVYFSFAATSLPQCPTGTVQLYVDGAAAGAPAPLTVNSCAQPIQLQTATLASGQHTIDAGYSGDAFFVAENSTPLAYTVTEDATTVTLATSSGTVNVGQPVTYTATVNPVAADNAAPPSGTVAFFDGANQIGTETLSAVAPYTASFTTSSLAAGPHSITATFTDTDGNFTASSSAVQTETVNLNVPAIDWTPAATTISYGTPLDGTELNATAVDSKGDPIAGTFSYNFPLNAMPGVGTANVAASFSPADPTTYSSNSTTISFTVNPATLTVTPNPVTLAYGGSLPVLSGSVAGLTAGDTLGGSIVVTYSSSIPELSAAGIYPGAITATVTGTSIANYSIAVTTAVLTIGKASSSVAFSATPTLAQTGTTETLSAMVGGPGKPGGTVVFTSGGTTLCSATVNPSGSASCTFVPSTLGTLSIQAAYAGDANHLASIVSLPLNVYDGSVQLHLSSTQLVYPGAANVTACVAGITSIGATGTIAMEDGTTVLTSQSLQGGGCAYWYISPGLAVGAHTLTAVYSGDRNNPAGTSVPVSVTVSPVPVTLSPSCWNASSSYASAYQCTVSVSSSAGAPQGLIAYSVDGESPATVPITGGNAQFTLPRPPAGSHNVAITYAQQTNYAAAAPQIEKWTVTPAPTQVQLTPSSYYQPSSSTLTLTASLTSWSAGAPEGGTVSFYAGPTLLGTVHAGASVNLPVSGLAPGTYQFNAVYNPDASGDWATASSSSVSVQLHP